MAALSRGALCYANVKSAAQPLECCARVSVPRAFAGVQSKNGCSRKRRNGLCNAVWRGAHLRTGVSMRVCRSQTVHAHPVFSALLSSQAR